MFVVYTLLVYLLNIVGAIFTVNMCYIPRCGFKAHSTSLVLAWSAHCHRHDDRAQLELPHLHGWWSFGLSASHPRADHSRRASLFMGQSQVLMTVVSSPTCYTLSKLSERPLALIVGSLLGPVWNDAWKMASTQVAHRGYWAACHRIPPTLIMSYVCFIISEAAIGSDKRGWDNDDENRLVLNCCKRGGLLIYGDEEAEKV